MRRRSLGAARFFALTFFGLSFIGLSFSATPSFAQELDPNNSDGDHGGFTLQPELDLEGAGLNGGFGRIQEVEQEQVAAADGAILRALDRVNGAVTDIDIATGQSLNFGRLSVLLSECRYPKDNPSGDAYTHLVIFDLGDEDPVFRGWMIASSPALNALDHPRYDVWVLRCKTS